MRVLDTPTRVLVESHSDQVIVRHFRGGIDRSLYSKSECKDLIFGCSGKPPGQGLYVWDGYVFDGDICAYGRWRECSNVERSAISLGHELWPSLPNGRSDDEMILVCESQVLRSEHDIEGAGFFADDDKSIYREMLQGHYDYRGELETDSRFKQVIPYVVMRDKGLLFCYERKAAGNEERLHNKYSMGVGGHVDFMTCRPDGVDVIEASAMRELYEEIEFPDVASWANIHEDSRLTYLGIINDDRDSVGKVHMGALFVAETRSHVDGGQVVQVRESDKMQGRWMTRREVESNLEDFESWSQIAYEAMCHSIV